MIFSILTAITFFPSCQSIHIEMVTKYGVEYPTCSHIPIYGQAFSSSCDSSKIYTSDETCSTTCANSFVSTCSCMVTLGFRKFTRFLTLTQDFPFVTINAVVIT